MVHMEYQGLFANEIILFQNVFHYTIHQGR